MAGAAAPTVRAGTKPAAQAGTTPAAQGTTSPQVLRVGTYNGVAGNYTSIRDALAAAHPGDWILLAPGDYKAAPYGGPTAGSGGSPAPAGAFITTPDIHLRGMNRNSVIIDGTRPGSPVCSPSKADQQFSTTGANGVEVYKASGTWVENLTVCNYLTNSAGAGGNEIWWNGGQGTGKIGMGSYWGDYITATSTYSNGTSPPYGDYGIYADNASGPGYFEHTYASNQGDSAYYIGACPDCNAVMSDAHAQGSALGYSGTNSGGHLIIENSVFDHNKSGLTSNSQNNDDAPSPQSGACPGGGSGPLGNGSCEIWRNNQVFDNNNPNVPGNSTNGLAGASPIGSGIVLAGTRQVTLYHNQITGNGSWGVLVADLPDQEYPPTTQTGQNCQGGVYLIPPGTPGQAPLCYYQALGNQVLSNSFSGNGGFGNPSNGDVGLFTTPSIDLAAPHHVYNADCFAGNTDSAGFTSDPPAVQSDPLLACNSPSPGSPDPAVVVEAECAAQLLASCPSLPGLNYPRPAPTFPLPMPPAQPTMPNPCAGVPANPWCP
ncbi:MAG TPA: hypothetical protein VG253_19210 [Streptosporangiaceae bacterium]|nr:hypothetical protein [Streptosporangiaceae bacterium]